MQAHGLVPLSKAMRWLLRKGWLLCSTLWMLLRASHDWRDPQSVFTRGHQTSSCDCCMKAHWIDGDVIGAEIPDLQKLEPESNCIGEMSQHLFDLSLIPSFSFKCPSWNDLFASFLALSVDDFLAWLFGYTILVICCTMICRCLTLLDVFLNMYLRRIKLLARSRGIPLDSK